MRSKRKENKNLEAIYKKKGSCCYYCETKVEFCYITRDHIKPKSKGNGIKGNWVFSCRSCNSKKSDMSVEDFVNYSLNIIVTVLRKIKNNNFIATEGQVQRIRHYHRLMMNTKKLL